MASIERYDTDRMRFAKKRFTIVERHRAMEPIEPIPSLPDQIREHWGIPNDEVNWLMNAVDRALDSIIRDPTMQPVDTQRTKTIDWTVARAKEILHNGNPRPHFE